MAVYCSFTKAGDGMTLPRLWDLITAELIRFYSLYCCLVFVSPPALSFGDFFSVASPISAIVFQFVSSGFVSVSDPIDRLLRLDCFLRVVRLSLSDWLPEAFPPPSLPSSHPPPFPSQHLPVISTPGAASCPCDGRCRRVVPLPLSPPTQEIFLTGDEATSRVRKTSCAGPNALKRTSWNIIRGDWTPTRWFD